MNPPVLAAWGGWMQIWWALTVPLIIPCLAGYPGKLWMCAFGFLRARRSQYYISRPLEHYPASFVTPSDKGTITIPSSQWLSKEEQQQLVGSFMLWTCGKWARSVPLTLRSQEDFGRATPFSRSWKGMSIESLTAWSLRLCYKSTKAQL